jgi:hypothetical protein
MIASGLYGVDSGPDYTGLSNCLARGNTLRLGIGSVG